MSATEETAAPARPSVEPVATEAAKPKKSRSMAWVGYLMLFLVAVIAAGGFFVVQKLRSGEDRQAGSPPQVTNNDQQIQTVTSQLSAIQSELATLHSQMATVQTQVSTEDSKFERSLGENATRLNDRIEATRTELGGAVQHIQRQLNKSRGDLMVADAEYLLSIANQKLHLVGDVKSVLAAMEAADQRLHDSGDPAVFKVREALADEIDTLKKMNAPDVVGISSKLLTLEKKVKNIPLFLPHADAAGSHAAKPETNGSTEPEGEGHQNDPVDSALKELKGLVTVRRTDRPIEAVLTPAEAEGIRQILLLKLEATRAALLRGDETLYKDSLTSASEWLSEHFEADAPETKELQGELNTLQSQSIAVPFPDISKSLSLLRNIEHLRLEAEEAEAKKAGAKQPMTPSPAPEAQPAPDADQGAQQ